MTRKTQPTLNGASLILSLNGSFWARICLSPEILDRLFLAVSRPSHYININVSYREKHASAADSNLT
jgi:hypothetical protein